MAVKVVDASAIGALLFGEPAGATIAASLSGASLVAPALLAYELANIAVKKLLGIPISGQPFWRPMPWPGNSRSMWSASMRRLSSPWPTPPG
jgi:hypothetical protein